jgi:hypothetical protein
MAHPQPRHCTLTVPVRATLVSDPSMPAVRAEFRYRPWDPFTVLLELALDQSPSVSWEFARDLVLTGIKGPVGLGDVRLFPGEHGVHLELYGQRSAAVLVLDQQDVERFLAESLRMVPVGGESEFHRLDDEIALLVSLPLPDARETDGTPR